MWFLIGWLLGRGRRWQSAEEREWRRRRGHPGLFVLFGFMAAGAFGTGAWFAGLVIVAVMLWLVVA